MGYKIYYYEVARLDIKEAKKWYRMQQKGLEKGFSQDVKITIHRLTENPFVHAVRYKDLRLGHLDKFPYAVHFYIIEFSHEIVITAILHNLCNPTIARKRIE